MLNHLKLRHRILLGYAVPIPLFVSLAGLVYINTRSVGELLNKVDTTRDALELTNRMESEASKMERVVRGYLLNDRRERLERFQETSQSLAEVSASARQLIQESQQQFFSEQQKKIVDEMVASIQQLRDIDEQMISLAQKGRVAEAIKLFSTDQTGELTRNIAELSNSFHTQADQDLLASQSALNTSMVWLNIIAVIGTLVTATAAVSLGVLITSHIHQQINDAVSTLASSSTQIAATVEQQERTSSLQAASVNQTTTTMDELKVSSQQSAEQVEAVAVGATHISQLAIGGTKTVGQSLEGMANLQQKMEVIIEQILRLSEQTNQIGTISILVSDLAYQTNMLALNAAVEAVRAGEHGKGFSVVASEIRKLADQSKQSAGRINALVADIQMAINSTVMATDEGNQTVDQGVRIAHETAETFSKVREAIDEMVVRIQQISLNVRQQAIAMQQMADAMNTINHGVSETAGGISQTKAGVTGLNSVAQDLQVMV